MILKNRMIYFVLLSALVVSVANLTHVTESETWELLFELMYSEL